MPTYLYKCSQEHTHERLRSVRETTEFSKCPECGKRANQVITPVALDWNMGVSHDFPTAAQKWDKIQRQKGSGEKWDSNNERYGGEYKDA